MAADRQKQVRLPASEAVESVVDEFRSLATKIIENGRKGSHDLVLSIDDFGRPKILVRGPFVHASQYDPS